MSNFTFIQKTPCTGALSETFAANNTGGNCIIAIVYAIFTGLTDYQGISGDVTDSQGNIYSCIQQSSAGSLGIYAATNIKAGANTVTATNASVTGILAMEYNSAAGTYYICPASGQDPSGSVNSVSTGFRGVMGGAFTSSGACTCVWAAFLDGTASTATAATGTVRFTFTLPGDYGCFAAAGDDAQSSISGYSNLIHIDASTSGFRVGIFLNLTGGCPGVLDGSGPPPGPGEGGTGQPDSSYGPGGSTLIPAANPGCLLVFYEKEDRWYYHRNAIGLSRFYGFLFDGVMMLGLTGTTPSGGSSTAVGFNVDDFRLYYTQDEPISGASIPIQCVFQSHFEDVALPDNQKNWLEIVVDYVSGNTDTLTVQVGYNNFAPATVGTLAATAGLRSQVSFPLGTDGILAKNISVLVYGSLTAPAEIHNVYLYYYVEARLALAASTIPIDLGSPLVKQCKELMLDGDFTNGANVNIYSDLPGNQLIANTVISGITSTGRAILKFPFAVQEGFLWRVAITAVSTGTFRLYSARLLMRPIGVYVEAYESAAGFVYDSMPHSFESLLTKIPRAYAIALSATPIKRYRELSLEIETFGGNVTVSFLTDLPGNTEVVRCTFTINTAALGRRFIRLPLPLAIGATAWAVGTTYAALAFVSYAGNSWQSLQAANTGHTPSTTSTWWQPLPIEGRVCRLQLSGTSKYVLYDAAVELLPIGLYIEAYEASTGAVYDSREMDFGSQKPKEARELELDIETTGPVTATLYCDLPGYTMTQCFQNTGVSTTGRQKILLPLTLDSAPYDYPIGRLFRLVITGTSAFRLYDAQLKLREFGCYLVGDEGSASPLGVWDSTPLDAGTERLKEYKKIELEVQTDSTGTATLKMWTDQPAGSLTQQFTTTFTTSAGRMSIKIPLTWGIRGRLFQVEVTGCGVRLFNGRIWARTFNDPKAQWAWVPLPIPPTAPEWAWAKFPVNPTPPTNDLSQWLWGKFTSVTDTPAEWTFIDVPFEVTGP